MNIDNHLKAYLTSSHRNPDLCEDFFRFRKYYFMDVLGWDLHTQNGLETDEFDREDTLYCIFHCGQNVIGGFRALRCDRPYLAKDKFSHLALQAYPDDADHWEISRFGLSPSHKYLGLFLYGLMFHFGLSRNAKGLVAVTEPSLERLLNKMGITTKRYGDPQLVGRTQRGSPIMAVAGEIPLDEAHSEHVSNLIKLTRHMEVQDDTLVFRPQLVQAQPAQFF